MKTWEQVEDDGWIRSYRWRDMVFERLQDVDPHRGQWEADLFLPEIGRVLTASGNSRAEAVENLLDKVDGYKGEIQKKLDAERERADKTIKMLGYFDQFRHRQKLGSNAIHS